MKHGNPDAILVTDDLIVNIHNSWSEQIRRENWIQWVMGLCPQGVWFFDDEENFDNLTSPTIPSTAGRINTRDQGSGLLKFCSLIASLR